MCFFGDKHPLSQSTRTLSLFTCTLKHFWGWPWMQCSQQQHLLQNLKCYFIMNKLCITTFISTAGIWFQEPFCIIFKYPLFCGTISTLRSKEYGYRSIAIQTYWHKLIYNKILCYVEFLNHIWYMTGLLTVSLVWVCFCWLFVTRSYYSALASKKNL